MSGHALAKWPVTIYRNDRSRRAEIRSLANKPVFLYVSKERMGAYRFRRYLDSLLNHKDSIKYFTVYALGRIVENPSVEVDDLCHLAIVLGPAKGPSETEGQA